MIADQDEASGVEERREASRLRYLRRLVHDAHVEQARRIDDVIVTWRQVEEGVRVDGEASATDDSLYDC